MEVFWTLAILGVGMMLEVIKVKISDSIDNQEITFKGSNHE